MGESSPARAPVGAAAAIERRNVQRMLHGVVRSTAAAAPAAVCEPVDGEAGSGERGEDRGERGA